MTDARLFRSTVAGFDAVVLENDAIRAVVLPTLGGRVWELEDKARGRQWIWHRDDVPLARASAGAAYDDVWAGGWEELFPNDAAGRFEGRTLPDHGEWWTFDWTVDEASAGPVAVLRLCTEAMAVRASCVKEFRLAAGAPSLSVTYCIRSGEPAPFHFLFKQHLPVAIDPHCRLRLPGGRVDAVDPAFGTVLPGPGPFAWPQAAGGGRVADLQIVPPREQEHREFVYVRDLPAGWCAVDDTRRGASLRMEYDAEVFPYVWLFLSYGGWRRVYTAVLEPCTNMPKDLMEAVRQGQSARLMPHQEFVTTVTVTVGEATA